MSRIGKEGQARVLKEEEFHRVIAHVRDTSRFSVRDCAILQVSYRCGLRAKEIAGLTLEDVLDMDGHVKEVITLRSKITKGSKVGKAYISHPEVRAALATYVAERSQISMLERNLFVSHRGKIFTANGMVKLFKRLYEEAGFYGASSHTGRRSVSSQLIKKGANIYQVKEILRHSSINTTARYFEEDEDTLSSLMRAV